MTIKEARHKAGLTQAEMSKLLEIPRRTIEDWERGIKTPPKYLEKYVIQDLLNRAKKGVRMKELKIKKTVYKDEPSFLEYSNFARVVENERYYNKELFDCIDEKTTDIWFDEFEEGFNEVVQAIDGKYYEVDYRWNDNKDEYVPAIWREVKEKG